MSKADFFNLVKSPQAELQDVFTGEVFQPKSRNHYEVNDGKPFAPQVELDRPSIRQRIENLLNRDPGVLRAYIDAQDDGSVDMDIPDDPEAPLTQSEANFLDIVAAANAEAAPLPDEGLPRLDATDQPESPPQAGDTPGGGGAPADSAPPKGASAEPSRGAPKRTGPTR